jgi:serine/threonine-protein kinase
MTSDERDLDFDLTGTAPRPSTGRPATSGPPPPGTSSRPVTESNPSGGRFLPGAIVDGRFRIVGLLGRGGMGEVYRADDLTLGQSIALKFLPEAFVRDEDRRARFFGEVRIARQIAHPNVCRIYDVGQAAGFPYLSMEFVDGDDLGSLLRRVGRLSPDRGVEVARQICAGLAAAHEKGVLHRDLKPDNIMIDGRGRVRIADFGLAAVAESVLAQDIRSGTPAYMAPEQMAGREVTRQSDIYALGLVLYELFTGRRAFFGKTIVELLRKHENDAPDSPSAVVPDLDPSIERAILRCLEKDPLRRPASALAVSLSLPGGDPLAAAIAAGETPSPELVAAGSAGQVIPRTQLRAAALSLVVGALVLPALSQRSWVTGYVDLAKPPAVLEDKAREVMRALGTPDRFADSAAGFAVDGGYLSALQKDSGTTRWEKLRAPDPPVLFYWYRESPRHLIPFNSAGVVFSGNPPLLVTDMSRATVDMLGRLILFQRVPPQKAPPSVEPTTVDWSIAFELAGLDLSSFRPVSPEWVPPFGFDTRLAWEKNSSDPSVAGTRVEAASFQGSVVSFQVVRPWDRPTRMEVQQMTPRQKWAQRVALGLLAVLVVATFAYARRSLASGRADFRGASRIAVALVVLSVIDWLLRAQHSSAANEELQLLVLSLSLSLFAALFVGVIYIALEPLARRQCPERLVSWTRLLAGRWNDPLVAGHVLLGAGVGAVAAILSSLPIEAAFGVPVSELLTANLEAMRGAPDAIAVLVQRVSNSVGVPIALLFALVGLERLTKRRALSCLVVALVLTGPGILNSALPVWVAAPWILLIASLPILVIARWGILPGLLAFYVLGLLTSWPLATDLSSWWATPTKVSLLLTAAIALYGLRYGVPRIEGLASRPAP